MSKIREEIIVHCPTCQADSLLETFFRENAEHTLELDRRHAARLALRAPLPVPGRAELLCTVPRAS